MSRFEEFCDVNGPQIRSMCKSQGTTVKEVAKKIGCSTTCLYVYLDRGKIPASVADRMMDAIWDGHPPFYLTKKRFVGECLDLWTEPMRFPIKKSYPSYYKNLLEIRRQIDIVIQQIQKEEANEQSNELSDCCRD